MKKKEKTFNVVYNYTTTFESTLKAVDEFDAVRKVKEVVGDCNVDNVWEVNA